MKPKSYRPPAVLVMAILNIVFGAIGLAFMFCGGAALAIMFLMPDVFPTAPGQPNIFKEMIEMQKGIPGFIAISIFNFIAGLIVSAALVIAGIGLLRMRLWARRLCVAYCVYAITWPIAHGVYTVIVVNPRVQQWTDDFNRRMGVGNVPHNTALSNVGAFVYAVLEIGYAIALLIVLYLPQVSAAFKTQKPPPGSHEEEEGTWREAEGDELPEP